MAEGDEREARDAAAWRAREACGDGELKEYLVVFAMHNMYFNMRFQELEALAELAGVRSRAQLYVEDPPPTALNDSPLVRVRLPGEAAAKMMCARAVMIKAVLEVWCEGPNFPEAVQAGLACDPAVLAARRAVLAPPTTMSVRVVCFGRTMPFEEKSAAIETLKPLFRGDEVVDIHNSQVIIWALEEHSHHTQQKTHLGPRSGTPRRVIVARQVAGGRSIDKKQKGGEKAFFQRFDLSERAVLGPTTMENQLAFIMANCACAGRGQLGMDPFCGTGGLLIAMSHCGVRTVGGEIDIRVAKGYRVAYVKNKDAAREVARKRAEGEANTPAALDADASSPAQADAGAQGSSAASRGSASLSLSHLTDIGIFTGRPEQQQRSNGKKKAPSDLPMDVFVNFEQYNLLRPDIVVCDAAMRPWRDTGAGWLDCIVTDPPYGVRAASKKQGRDPSAADVEIRDSNSYVPSKVGYGEEELSRDLCELAAKSLKDGGRLVYLLPVDLADLLGIDRSAELGETPDCAAERLRRGTERTLHDVAMPRKGRHAKDPRLCVSETTRDPAIIDEANYTKFLPKHADLELVGASMQVLSGGLGRLLVTMRRRPRQQRR
eukprot:TRINITY_DN2499_c0_g8_i1.p1 TRINITY_DN2499_c0_g8~~TRINITY_DN2499_c0_g8_i1.p1  ORF type:complete len:603 (+),score=145.12 TRINITY_DN2499_c0_g8_i1:182-1990(+)